jgi:poly(3-hydroxybutyrate) depolymerase
MKNCTLLRRQRYVRAALFLLFFLTSFMGFSQLVQKNLVAASNGRYIGFYQWTPADYDPAKKYPLIVFMHGKGEIGNGKSDLPKVLANGLMKNLANGSKLTFTWNGKTETFIVLAPQLDGQDFWWRDFHVDEMINYAKKNLSLDEDRIYVTGLSLGGGGAWTYPGNSLANAQRIAAMAQSCGTCQSMDFCNIAKANLPVWGFHAQDDGTVGVGCTTSQIGYINQCNPAVKPYMTIWPTGGHGIWSRVYDEGYTYNNPNVYEWFLGQNRSLPVNVRPTANAGSAQTISTSTGKVILDASKSTDKDGKIVRYIWSKLSGPAAGTIATAVSTDGIATVTGLTVAGTYEYEVKVVDDRADWVTASVKITVTSGTVPDQKPTANAGSDITITLPATATLNGSASSDPEGPVTYSWAWVSGPTIFTLPLPTAVSPIVSALLSGTYVFRLTVTDNKGQTATDDVSIIVKPLLPINKAPVANAGTDIAITLPATTTLNGSGSSDPDGAADIATYTWSWVSGPTQYTIANAGSASTGLSNLAAGTYVFKLVVKDNGGLTNEDQVTVKVNPAPPPPNKLPVANAGTDISITLPIDNTTLDGSASADPDGTINGYSWNWISGPTQYTVATAGSVSTKLSNLVQGTYTFELTVTDNAGATAKATVKVVVNPAPPPPNKLPVANAGNDITLTLPSNSTKLDGSASKDPDGTIATWAWTKTAGPATYTLSATNIATPDLTGLVEGTYTFELVVTDNSGATGKNTVNVIVNQAAPPANKQPVAVAGNNITITLPANSTTLDGTGSNDPDGTIQTYEWTKLTGPASYTLANANGSTTALGDLTEGTYTFQLKVWDNVGATATTTLTVTVNPEVNKAPVANAGGDISITLPTTGTTLNGSGSSDPNGNATIKSYMWAWVSGPAKYAFGNPYAASTSLTGLSAGTYVFELTVTDNGGLSSKDQVTVVVNAKPNAAPAANAGSDITITLPANSVTLNGAGSTDPDGNNTISYAWAKVSGLDDFTMINMGTSTPKVVNLSAGTYVFELTVTDDGGLTSKDQVTIIVNTPGNSAPTANAGGNITLTLPANSATLNGTGSTDPDGKGTLTYTWTKIAGPDQYTIGAIHEASTSLTNLAAGVYTFVLTVTDNFNVSDTDTITVTVSVPPNVLPIANAGTDQTYPQPIPVIQLNGTGSIDPDGQIETYSWSKVSGPDGFTMINMNSSRASLAGLTEGYYEFELTVTDNRGGVGKDIVRITVGSAANKAPVANAGKDTTIAAPATSVTLNGQASVDPDGAIVEYSWKQYSGPNKATISGNTASATASDLQPGKYVFELTVTDNRGATAKDLVTITVVNNMRYTGGLTIYPNPAPAHSQVTIRVITDTLGMATITLMDQFGRPVMIQKRMKTQAYQEFSFPVSHLKPGSYYLEVQIERKQRMITKFIKR